MYTCGCVLPIAYGTSKTSITNIAFLPTNYVRIVTQTQILFLYDRTDNNDLCQSSAACSFLCPFPPNDWYMLERPKPRRRLQVSCLTRPCFCVSCRRRLCDWLNALPQPGTLQQYLCLCAADCWCCCWWRWYPWGLPHAPRLVQLIYTTHQLLQQYCLKI